MHRSVFLLKGYRIVFSYHQVQEHPKLFLAMTGLTQAEFDQLLPHFQCAWEQYVHIGKYLSCVRQLDPIIAAKEGVEAQL